MPPRAPKRNAATLPSLIPSESPATIPDLARWATEAAGNMRAARLAKRAPDDDELTRLWEELARLTAALLPAQQSAKFHYHWLDAEGHRSSQRLPLHVLTLLEGVGPPAQPSPDKVERSEGGPPQAESRPHRELREFVPLVENPCPYQPNPPPPGRNPYLTLRHVLHELFWQAACAQQGQDVVKHINPTTDPWDDAETRARSGSAGWGIPFGTFDPILTDARRTMRQLVQVAAGNTSVAFSALVREAEPTPTAAPSVPAHPAPPNGAPTVTAAADGETAMPRPTNLPAPFVPPRVRFSPVSANPLPQAVQISGTIYGVGPLNSPPGDGWLPADLLAAFNLASAHVSMAKRLLGLVEGLEPGEYQRRVRDTRYRQVCPSQWTVEPNELAHLAYELTCQNGAEVITALLPTLTAANPLGAIQVGRLTEEQNAHAAAYVAAHQLANEVLNGWPLSINTTELDVLAKQTRLEALRAAGMRACGTQPSTPPAASADAKGKGRKGATKDKPALNDLSARAWHALRQYRQAVRALAEQDGVNEADVTDKAAYKYLKSEGVELPALDTWTRYLRKARNALGQQKRKLRPKYDGRSAAPPDHFGDRSDD